jgi:hypothetical protein
MLRILQLFFFLDSDFEKLSIIFNVKIGMQSKSSCISTLKNFLLLFNFQRLKAMHEINVNLFILAKRQSI